MAKALSTLALFIFAINAFGQWIQHNNGLFGGQVNSVINLNGKIFAGTSGGVFVSSDSAVTWSPANNGLGINDVVSLRAINNTLYAAVRQRYIYRSTTEGATWTPIEVGAFTNKLAVIGDTVFASQDGWNLKAFRDGATNPQLINSIQSPSSFAASSNRLLLGSFDDGIFASDDRGESWHHQALTGRVYSLSESNEKLLGTTDGGVFISLDRGSSWNSTDLPLSTQYILLDIGSKLLATSWDMNTLESTDGGLTWNYNASQPTLTSITSDTKRFYGGGSTGVYRTNDLGEFWEHSNTGMTNANVKKIRSLNGNLFALSGNRLFKSDNNGESWNKIDYGNDTEDLQCISQVGNSIYAGTWNTVYSSSDSGATWSFEPSVPGGMVHFAATSDKLFIWNVQGLFASSDNGTSWQLASSIPWVMGMNAIQDDLFVFSTVGNFKVSGDGTQTQLGNLFRFDGNKDLLTSVVRHDAKLIATTNNSGIIYSIDGGMEWRHYTDNSGALEIVEKDNILYVATYQQGVLFSADGGLSWESANQGLNIRDDWWEGWSPINDLEIVDGQIFAATSWGGVWGSSRQSIVTGIETNKRVLIYPNPTDGEVSVDLTTFHSRNTKQIQILGTKAELMFELLTNNESETINLSSFPSGLYLIRINDSKSSHVSKIIKK